MSQGEYRRIGNELRELLQGLLQVTETPSQIVEGRFFPEVEEIELEGSTLTIPLYRNGEFVETLELAAYLRLAREKPFRNPNGVRTLEFRILQWEAVGQSEALGGYLTYSLSDVPQPKSIVVADQPDRDFPATIVYSAIHDVFLNGQSIATNVPGLGVGKGVMQIPPRNITVGFQKAFEGGEVATAPGNCSGMTSLSRQEFEEGVGRVRVARQGRA